MFNCGHCGKPSEPRVKPLIVTTQTREVDYHNVFSVEDEWGKRVRVQVDSVGREIVSEEKICPDCAENYGLPAQHQKPITKPTPRFQERLAEPLHNKLIALVVHTTLDKLGFKSKRAQRDCAVAVPGIKEFTDDNKDYTF